MTSLALRDIEHEAAKAEELRLEALDRFDVLDTPREAGFDGIVRLIRNIFDVPVGIVSVIDGHRQWYKACEGLSNAETPRKDTFCEIAIRQQQPLIVLDAQNDVRFSSHPSVTGAPHVRFYAGVPMRTRDGHNIGTLCAVDFKPRGFSRQQVEIMTDLARVAMAEFEMRQLVTVDSLTGVMARRAFKEEGMRALALARRHQLDMSCIAIDLDHFKAVNDRYGHAAGDRVLTAVASRCRELVRRTDQIGRLGGEEFAILLPHTDRRGALDAAEKLRAAIAALSIDIGGASVGVTASFGVTTMDPDLDDIDTLLARADAALYEAKGAGRNRVAAWRRGGDAERSVRRRVLKAGRISFGDRRSTIDCTVRFLSDEGAGLDVTSTLGIPERFDLLIGSDRVDQPCRVVSKSDRHIEAEFC